MVQSINSTQKIEETDGLPMPKRIWAVVSVGFALCMSVLDINIVNIVLPSFRMIWDFSRCNHLDYQRLSAGHRHIATVFSAWVKSSVTGKSFFRVSACFASLR